MSSSHQNMTGFSSISSPHFNHTSSHFAQNMLIEDDISLDFLDSETLSRQVKVYRAEYYKALDINRELIAENEALHEKLRNQGHCSTHIETISNLSRKLNEYESIIIPKLKEEIRKYRDSVMGNLLHGNDNNPHLPGSRTKTHSSVVRAREFESPDDIRKKRSGENSIEQIQVNNSYTPNKGLVNSPKQGGHGVVEASVDLTLQ